MQLSIDDILEIVEKEMPELEGLSNDRDRIEETLEALSLEEGENYLSLGIGQNILPLIVALHGVNVTGFDIDEGSLQYQKQLYEKFSKELKEAGGNLTIFNFNYDDPIATKPIDGFETPEVHSFHGEFDVVESIFLPAREGSLDMAYILRNYGKPASRYLIFSAGGGNGYEDSIVNELIGLIQREIRDQKRSFKIIDTDLYVSNGHSNQYGVVLRVFDHPMNPLETLAIGPAK